MAARHFHRVRFIIWDFCFTSLPLLSSSPPPWASLLFCGFKSFLWRHWQQLASRDGCLRYVGTAVLLWTHTERKLFIICAFHFVVVFRITFSSDFKRAQMQTDNFLKCHSVLIRYARPALCISGNFGNVISSCILSCGWFPGVWILYSDVSKHCVPERWHVKFRRPWITQKKENKTQNTEKVWNQ